MKIRLSLFSLALALMVASIADAQLGHPLMRGGHARAGFSQVAGNLLRPSSGRPGRLWFEANLADQGLGFNSSYFTVGAKNRLFEDRFDGRWLVEGQVNHSLDEDGGLFANIGIQRYFSIESAGADVGVGVWYDYDGDRQGNFAHTFHQVGISGTIKTKRWDLIGNGYLPTGIQDYVSGDLTGANTFVGNNIVLIPGIDSALQGFDVSLRLRPRQLAFANGSVDLGGYHYNSDVINAFAGAKVRLGVQAMNGMMVNLEVNHDNRFETTGVLGIGWVFGANASGVGHEYSVAGRDLEATVRNDHIVRFNQELVLAIDPDTGAAYNVVHVDNTADPAFENGTAELPFTSLELAQNLSSPGDIILVRPGDGTDRNYDTGIQLQDDQSLFGLGQSIQIPVQGGELFDLIPNPDGVQTTISNSGGFSVVQLANNNDVAGLNIDASGARFGVWGDSTAGGSIRSTTITDATDDGVRLNAPSGDWTFANNNISDNGGHGVFIFDSINPATTFNFEENVANGNGLDGIHFLNFDPSEFTMLNNTTNNNLRGGLLLENFFNSSGEGLSIVAHTANANAGDGIFLNFGSGNLDLLNIDAQNNLAGGIIVRNWATATDERVFIGITEGGVSNVSGNGAPANLQFIYDDAGIDANAVVTGMSFDNGVRGIGALVEGVTPGGDRSTLDLDIIDNIQINGNVNDGIRLVAINGGLLDAEIGNTVGNQPLQLFQNAIGGGDGISIFTDGLSGQAPGEVRALVDNVFINNAVSRVFLPNEPVDFIVFTDGVGINGANNSVVDVTVLNSTIGQPGFPNVEDVETQVGVNVAIDNTNNQLVNRVTLDNLTMFNEIGLSVVTGDGTFADVSMSNSQLFPNETQTTPGQRADNTGFDADDAGDVGVFVLASGQGALSGQSNRPDIPDLPFEYGFFETVSDGVIDNLTRVSLENNTIQDFHFEGVDVTAIGDAHVLLDMVGNRIQNNGAGGNNDNDNDDVYNEQVADGLGATADVDNLTFFDGVNIDAFDQSVVSARIVNNIFVDNFERGLSLNTFSSATINALVENNTFFGNDRGEDTDNTFPRTGTGIFDGGEVAIVDAATFDFEAINNEEFYRRFHESQIFTNPDNGNPIDPTTGDDLGNDLPGFLLPGNIGGTDFFGNPIAFGVATMNLSMANNALQLGPDLENFAVAPGEFNLGLDGSTNGFTNNDPLINNVPFPFAGGLIDNEESFFQSNGF